MPIPCPHFKITIVKRSQGQSAVAGAAYQSGERLFSEYDQKTKFYNKKKELVHAEIMLPSHAPPGYADRATLWNAVEAVENQWNSQLARRIVLAFPVEIPKEQYKEQSDLFTTSISEVCFYTDDIDSVYKTLIENHVECLSEPQYFDFRANGFGESRAFYFRDPDGIILEMMQTL